MKLSLEQFNQLIAKITTARQLQKNRNEQKALEEELQKEDIETLQRVLQPVLENTVASPIHKLQEGVIKNLKQLEAPEGTQEKLSLVVPSTLRYDPDQELDFELLEHYKLLKPSEIVDEEEPRELVCAYIKDIDTKLMSWGGQIANVDKHSEVYKGLRRKIDGMRVYKDRIKNLLKVLPLVGRGGEMPKGPNGPKGRLLKSLFSKNPIQYKYYSSPDELINRLELLCAERDIGNDSIEVRNEIMSILDILLKSKIIDKVGHEEMFNKWCS